MSSLLYSQVATKDAGVSKNGEKKDSYTRGIELIARQTVFAEGARGSCSEEIISKFDLRRGKDMQTYGLGIKEVWRIPQEKLKPGYIQVSFVHYSSITDCSLFSMVNLLIQ